MFSSSGFMRIQYTEVLIVVESLFVCSANKAKRLECRRFPSLPLSCLYCFIQFRWLKKQQNKKSLILCFPLFIKQLISECGCCSRPLAILANVLDKLPRTTGWRWPPPPISGWPGGVELHVMKY